MSRNLEEYNETVRAMGKSYQSAIFICEVLRKADTAKIIYKDSGSFDKYLRPNIELLLKTVPDYQKIPELEYIYQSDHVIIHWKDYLNK
jgi:hypothetical protein